MYNSGDQLYSYLQQSQSVKSILEKNSAVQTSVFQIMNTKCSKVEQSIHALQKLIIKLEDRLQILNQEVQSKKMNELRDKQNRFIVGELEHKIARLTANEEQFLTQLNEKSSLIMEMEFKMEELSVLNQELKDDLAHKTKQLKLFNLNKSHQKSKKSIQISGCKTPTFLPINSKEETGINAEQYEELEGRLKQIQDCLNEEIEKYKSRNKKLESELRCVKADLHQNELNKKKIYESELKIKHLNAENKELQESYTAALQNHGKTQITLQQSIMDLKVSLQKQRKEKRKMRKQVEKQLKSLAEDSLDAHEISTIFVGTKNIIDMFEELKRTLSKSKKRFYNSVNTEKDLLVEELNRKISWTTKQNEELTLTVSRLLSEKKQVKAMNSSSNQSVSNNKNSSRSEISGKDKGEVKIEELKKKVQERQAAIEEIRQKFDEQQVRLQAKILALSRELAQGEMELKYIRKKVEDEQARRQEVQNQLREKEADQQQKSISKSKNYEQQIHQLRTETKKIEEVLVKKQKLLAQSQKLLIEAQDKIKKYEIKFQNKTSEHKKVVELKDESMEELVKKNQLAYLEIKLLNEKIKIMQANQEPLPQSRAIVTPTYNKDLEEQILMERERILEQLNEKNQQIENMKMELEQKQSKILKNESKIAELQSLINSMQIEAKRGTSENKKLEDALERVKLESEMKCDQLKEEYEGKENSTKKSYEKMLANSRSYKNEMQLQMSRLSEQLKQKAQQHEKMGEALKEKEELCNSLNAEKFKMKEMHRNAVKQLSEKISELQKVAQVPAKSAGKQIQSIKSTSSFEIIETGVMTDVKVLASQGMNTMGMFEAQLQMQRSSKNNNNILSENEFPEALMQNQEEAEQTLKQKKEQELGSSNLFMNLNANHRDNEGAFEICDQEEEINFGQSAINLQIRQVFSHLRLEVQKLFNEQEISLSLVNMLPAALQDDYLQFITYIKEKIAVIKAHNEISFIMAEPGNEPQLDEQDSLYLPQIFLRRASEGELKRVIEEKEAMIHSLMNERTSQENTINQLTMEKEEIEEENENKFMNQCNVYKKQIKEHKKTIDFLEMNFQSLKNITRNVLELFSAAEQNQDDFRDNMTMLAKIGKLNEKERSRLNYYIQRYIEIKSST